MKCGKIILLRKAEINIDGGRQINVKWCTVFDKLLLSLFFFSLNNEFNVNNKRVYMDTEKEIVTMAWFRCRDWMTNILKKNVYIPEELKEVKRRCYGK